MTVRDIIEWPAPVLSQKSEEVTDFGSEIKTLVADMHETMAHAGGIGLAANQVNVAKRVLVITIPYKKSKYAEDEEETEQPWHNKAWTFINPKIIKLAGKTRYQEGCLSFPEIYDFVDRAEEIWIEAFDENGKKFEFHAHGLMAICLQHEIDHIDGIVFINRMSRLKRSLISQKMKRRGHMVVGEEV